MSPNSKFRIPREAKWRSSIPDSRRGQALLEVILAIAVFAAIAGVLITMAVGGFRGLEQGGEQTEAEALAQEGIEAVRAVRDKAWNENIALNNQTARPEESLGQWTLTGYGAGAETIGKFSRTLTFNDVCRDGTDVIISCTPPPVPPAYNDPHTKEAVVIVSWTNRTGQNNSIQQRAYISNWDSRDQVEDTSAAFSDGIFSSTAPSSLGDGESVTLQPE